MRPVTILHRGDEAAVNHGYGHDCSRTAASHDVEEVLWVSGWLRWFSKRDRVPDTEVAPCAYPSNCGLDAKTKETSQTARPTHERAFPTRSTRTAAPTILTCSYNSHQQVVATVTCDEPPASLLSLTYISCFVAGDGLQADLSVPGAWNQPPGTNRKTLLTVRAYQYLNRSLRYLKPDLHASHKRWQIYQDNFTIPD
jgi:hypothetical protein